MEKKICSTRFHNFRQVEAENKCRFPCIYRGLSQKSRLQIFSGTSKFRNSHNFHEIDKKSNRKPKRRTMILVTYAVLTILVSYA